MANSYTGAIPFSWGKWSGVKIWQRIDIAYEEEMVVDTIGT